MITLIKAPHTIASGDLGEPFKANEPIGTPIAMIRSKDFREGPDAGVWECTPGKWRRAIKSAEFARFVAGRCKFHPDGGETIEINAGDSVYFPANTSGTWEVIDTVRKTFFLVPG